jgi:hypothetical protein
MDILALGNFVLLKSDQPTWPEARGEGLESEDAAVDLREAHPEEFLEKIRRAFHQNFLPVAAQLRKQKSILVDETFLRGPSKWVDAEESLPRPMPDVPDAARFVEDLVGQWHAQPAAQAFRPVLIELVAAGLKYPIEEETEKVSESIYVMF